MNRIKKPKWLLLLAVILVLLVFSFWYMRPVTIYDMEEGLQPHGIAITVIRVGTEPEMEKYDLFVQEGDAGFDEILQQIAALRFSRYPTNVLLQFFPEWEEFGPSVTAIHGYDYHIDIAVKGRTSEAWNVRLHYDLGKWRYHDLEHDMFLPMRSIGQSGKEIGDGLVASIVPPSSQSK